MDKVSEFSDISLDEVNMDSTNNSTEAIYPAASVSRPWWSRRTGLEKGLLASLALCGMVMIAGGCVFALSGPSPMATHKFGDAKVEKGRQDPPHCETPECVLAAADIISSMDKTADPCQDFFRFSCGGWIDSNSIPSSSSKWGKFYELRDNVDAAVKDILEASSDSSDSQSAIDIRNMYSACTDIASIESSSYNNIKDLVYNDEFGGWPMILNFWDDTLFSWESVAGQNLRYQISDNIISVFPYLDSFDTSRNVLHVDQPSFGLPRSMYLDPSSFSEYINAYKEYIVDVAEVMSNYVGEAVPRPILMAAADNIFNFEQELATHSVADENRRNTSEMYNPRLLSELKTEYPLDWDRYFSAVLEGTSVTIDDNERLILVEPEYMEWVLPVVVATPNNVVADYLYWRRIMTAVNEGPEEFRDIRFKFTSVLYGQSEQVSRWSYCVNTISSDTKGLSYAVGGEYVKANFDDETKAQAEELVADIRASFNDLLDESTWMDPATQILAQEKADMMVSLIGYPDWVKDNAAMDAFYEGIRHPLTSTHYLNVQGAQAFAAKKALETLRKVPDRNEWITQPAIVNAFYSPVHNSISFPAGILQPPFFGKGYPRSVNYGAIGVVIGHEISHGFDDQGRQYDGSGNAAQWWTDESIQAFTTKAQCYIDQYNGFDVPELENELGTEAHVNGINTQGENIADNGGVHEAFRAYTNSIISQGPEGLLPGLLEFTPEQIFFIAYAQLWCEKTTDEGLLNQILTDPHSPGKFRVIGPLQNSPDFQDVFSCPAGTPMTRPPQERCDLW